ncbi:MAG: carbonic anhydrase [Rhodospirillales bacterium]
MESLIAGYRRFRSGLWPTQRARFESLAREGQSPRALVIACSDSRADPQMIFDARPGELFMVRNVANLVPPYQPDAAYHGTSAALEFGLKALKIPDVIVMGHGLCGGVQALLAGPPPGVDDFVAPWMRIAEPARLRVQHETDPAAQARACEHETVRLSLRNLRTFPWVDEAVAAGRLRLHGCYFDIRFGVLTRLGPDGEFHPVDA